MLTENEVLDKLTEIYGTEFKISAHETNDEEMPKRIVVRLKNGRYRTIDVSIEELQNNFESANEIVKSKYNFIINGDN